MDLKKKEHWKNGEASRGFRRGGLAAPRPRRLRRHRLWRPLQRRSRCDQHGPSTGTDLFLAGGQRAALYSPAMDDEDPWRQTIAKELLDELVFPSLSPYVFVGIVLFAVMLLLMLANTIMLAVIIAWSLKA